MTGAYLATRHEIRSNEMVHRGEHAPGDVTSRGGDVSMGTGG